MPSRPLGIGIVGFGFMGRTHAAGYLAALRRGMPIALRGVVGSLEGFELAGFTKSDEPIVRFAAAEALLDSANIAAVSICTYTDSHVDLALAALARGKHVLLEKPVALSSGAVIRLEQAARGSGLVCMPAMCMRFWPGWPWLRELIRGGALGAVKRAEFARIGARPSWGTSFYPDESRSGGALFDLHIHDADFVRWCFGNPAEVSSAGSIQDITTTYRFGAAGARVSARGAWLPDPATPFSMRYEVEFKRGTALFDLATDPAVQLLRGKVVQRVTLPTEDAYAAEVRHFLELVLEKVPTPVAPLQDAVAVTQILEAEAESLATGRAVAPKLSGQ